jgi:hypothetical protein
MSKESYGWLLSNQVAVKAHDEQLDNANATIRSQQVRIAVESDADAAQGLDAKVHIEHKISITPQDKSDPQRPDTRTETAVYSMDKGVFLEAMHAQKGVSLEDTPEVKQFMKSILEQGVAQSLQEHQMDAVLRVVETTHTAAQTKKTQTHKTLFNASGEAIAGNDTLPDHSEIRAILAPPSPIDIPHEDTGVIGTLEQRFGRKIMDIRSGDVTPLGFAVDESIQQKPVKALDDIKGIYTDRAGVINDTVQEARSDAHAHIRDASKQLVADRWLRQLGEVAGNKVRSVSGIANVDEAAERVLRQQLDHNHQEALNAASPYYPAINREQPYVLDEQGKPHTREVAALTVESPSVSHDGTSKDFGVSVPVVQTVAHDPEVFAEHVAKTKELATRGVVPDVCNISEVRIDGRVGKNKDIDLSQSY